MYSLKKKRFKEQAYEYDDLIGKHCDLKKEKEYYEEKYKNVCSELSVLKRVREKNEELEAKCSQLSVLIEALEKREQSNSIELQRLRDEFVQ